eukprot:CAMPEP_0174859746 /NCGR_PEP_ID=MMETSP1114-20130205/47242_1 /TAXON_ID=312471 /ORGANISM="Neobodo designis, Strain CCAP 1951/1" /LENGTH=209 /DNA_ID=CAMNT_0016094705 /DNA_START=76 /DNA_END=701 /DNA_ORIENTATION=-
MSSSAASETYIRLCKERGVRPNQAVAQQLAASDVRSLDLRRNYVGPRGAVCVADALRFAPSVESIDLSSSQLSNTEAVCIAHGLAVAPHVRTVDLSGNPAISAAGGRALLRIVRAGCVDSVRLDGTSVPPACVKLVGVELERARSRAESSSTSMSPRHSDMLPPQPSPHPPPADPRAAARALFLAAADASVQESLPLSRLTGFALLIDA